MIQNVRLLLHVSTEYGLNVLRQLAKNIANSIQYFSCFCSGSLEQMKVCEDLKVFTSQPNQLYNAFIFRKSEDAFKSIIIFLTSSSADSISC